MSQTKAQLINAVDGSIVDADIVGLTSSKLSGALPAISGASLTNISAGKILQAVNATHATQLELNDTTVTDTGLTANITMTGASNKVLILVCQQMMSRQYNSAGFANGSLILTRVTSGVSTNVYNSSAVYGSCTSSGPGSGSYFVASAGIMSIVAEDTPGAGTHTYKTRLKHETRSGTTTSTCRGGHPSEIQLLEIEV